MGMNRQPGSLADAPFGVATKMTFTGAAGFGISGSATFYQQGSVPNPTIMPCLLETVGEPQVYPSVAPTVDTTAGANGMVLKKGLYKFDICLRFGDGNGALNGGAGTVNDVQFALIIKGTADATGLIMLSPVMTTAAQPAATQGSFDSTSSVWRESAYFEIPADLTVVQLAARRTIAGTASATMKNGWLIATRVADTVAANV